MSNLLKVLQELENVTEFNVRVRDSVELLITGMDSTLKQIKVRESKLGKLLEELTLAVKSCNDAAIVAGKEYKHFHRANMPDFDSREWATSQVPLPPTKATLPQQREPCIGTGLESMNHRLNMYKGPWEDSLRVDVFEKV